MNLSLGIVGLPNVGKSTLFNILTKSEVDAQNYPFCTIDPNVGIVSVPDERLDILAELSNSKKKIPAVIEFFDIAGLVKGAAEGEGLGNKFLSHIKEVDAIVHVVRVFKNDHVIHVDSTINPVRDIETINTELILKDLEIVERRIKKTSGEAKTGNREAKKELELLTRIKEQLDQGKLIVQFANEPIMREMQLLSSKKQLFLLNGTEDEVSSELKNKIRELDSEYIVIPLGEAGDLSELIRAAYKTLNLISFFTTPTHNLNTEGKSGLRPRVGAGEDETRAWTIERGTKAPQAAGVIHSDFENKFIRAEAIFWEKLKEIGNWNEARSKGQIRTEGKEYAIKDGDVIVVRHGS